MTRETYDLLIIGGGINGASIARDAAGRGLSVLLCEMGDLAGATSSASSKMIHGGLRYLELYEFRLVGEALGERRVLLARLLTRRAPLWVLDEAFNALDSQAVQLLGELVGEHLADGGLAVLTSHQSLPLPGGQELRL